jgi:ubiquinone biosynthesis protein
VKFTRLGRSAKILHTFLYFRLYQLVPERLQPWYLRFLLTLLVWYPKVSSNVSNAANLRAALESLGPVWIKFGQMLTTLKDLLSDLYSQELSKLQHKVSP